MLIQVSCLIALCFTFTTIIFLKWLSSMRKRSPPLPPGPTGYPIIGCFPQMVMNKPAFRWIHQVMHEMKTEIACFRLGNSLIIPVSSPELACEFLKKHDSIFSMRPSVTSTKVLSSVYPTSIFLSSYGDRWKKMKRVLASEVLSTSMLQQFHDKRRAEGDELARYVYNQCQSPLNNGLVNVRTISRFYCSNIIKKMFFNKRFFGVGVEDGGPGIEDREHMDATFTTLSYLYGFAIGDFLPWLEVFDFDGHKKKISDAINIMKKYQDPEIDERVKMWKQGIRKSEEDILDRLINLKGGPNNNPLLTSDEIKSLINEILLASIDNPSNTVEWSLGEMINEPSILEKACNELDRVVGRDRLVEESDLPELNYIKACAKESLRMHPMAPFNLPHASLEDVIVGGYLIPKGSQVLLSRAGLGCNPRVWKEPLKYNPDRHIYDDLGTGEVVLGDPNLQMLSFSTGRRGCPGVALGSTLTCLLLARLIQGFHWRAPSHGPGTIDLTESDNLLMKNPLVAHAEPRLEPNVYQQTYR